MAWYNHSGLSVFSMWLLCVVCVICAFCLPDHVDLWLWRRRCSKGQPALCIFTQTSLTPRFLVGCPGALRTLSWFDMVKSCVSTEHQKSLTESFWHFFDSFTLWAPFLQLGERLANKCPLTCQQGPHLGLPESHSSQ